MAAYGVDLSLISPMDVYGMSVIKFLDVAGLYMSENWEKYLDN